jgi:hypothetical protein
MLNLSTLHEEVRFVEDSLLEEDGFELAVPPPSRWSGI